MDAYLLDKLDVSGDTGPGLLEWINMVWREEFQFPHIKLIFPSADPM